MVVPVPGREPAAALAPTGRSRPDCEAEACLAADLSSRLSECMFECSSSACLPLGGVAAPAWCLCQGAGVCAVSAASRSRSGCGTAGPQGSSGAGGCTRSCSCWTGRSLPPRRLPTPTPRRRARQPVARQAVARQPVAQRPVDRQAAARQPAARGDASAGGSRRRQGEACRRLPMNSAATWHLVAGGSRVPESTAVTRARIRLSREALVRFPYCIRV
jgi:hypothetical protein